MKIGDNTQIHAGVKIEKACEIGKNCILHAGVVIGSDGFGFVPTDNGSYRKIPQIGNVVVEDDVEIGANTTIDRATFGSTLISLREVASGVFDMGVSFDRHIGRGAGRLQARWRQASVDTVPMLASLVPTIAEE